MLKLLFLLVVADVFGGPYDRQRFKQDPILIKKDCDVKKLVGTWFINYHKPPCSWKGSEEFSNMVKQVELDGTVKLHWRTGNGCVKNIPIDSVYKGNGLFHISDRIGDVITGEKILVCSDYDKYAIYWGCTRRCVKSNTCLDPYVSVMTRERELVPGSRVYIEIAEKLLSLWHMTFEELVYVNQDEKACCIPKKTPTVDPIAEPEPKKQLPFVP